MEVGAHPAIQHCRFTCTYEGIAILITSYRNPLHTDPSFHIRTNSLRKVLLASGGTTSPRHPSPMTDPHIATRVLAAQNAATIPTASNGLSLRPSAATPTTLSSAIRSIEKTAVKESL